MRAALNVPMIYRDELLGVLSLYETGSSVRTFDDDDTRLIAGLTAVAASAVKNARMRVEAERSAEMDHIVAGIATRFIKLNATSIDFEIRETLRLIGEFAGVDRSYLFRISGDRRLMANTHEWCAPGIEPQIENLQDLDAELMPWLMRRFEQGAVTYVRSLDELPSEAGVEKEVLAAQDIQSVVLLPIMFDEKAIGFIGFDAVRHTRSWSEHDIGLLKLIAEVFALALDRAQAEHALRTLNQELEVRVVERTAALRASEEQMRLLAENSSDLICLQSADGKLLYVSPASEHLLGYAPDELMGGEFCALCAPEEEVRVRDACAQLALRAAGDSRSFEHQIRHRSAGHIWFETSASVTVNRGTGTRQLITISRDITQRKLAETALVNALVRERELGELKSRFVAMASHEFRTPLAAILANAETLIHYRERLDAAQIDLRLGRICGQVDHLSQMIDEILSLTRVQAGGVKPALEPTDLAQFCRRIVEEFSGRIDVKHSIEYRCGSEPLQVAADGKLLRTVITNLLSNAIKYSPNGAAIRVTAVRRGGCVVLRVADSGIGIPEKDRERLFYAFHRGSNVGNLAGTGLGLSIAKEFLTLMDGDINFESTVGAGTTFEISLPAQAAISSESLRDVYDDATDFVGRR
jgi:PAS domain S-box-containing protein